MRLGRLFRLEVELGNGLRRWLRPRRFPSIRTMVEADLRGWLPLMGVFLPEDQIETILRQAERVLAEYVTADQRMVFPISAHLLIG